MGKDRGNKPGLVDDSLQGLTYKVIGLAMAVHNDLGPGHREETYHNAMTQRFADAGLAAEREPTLPIFDENGSASFRQSTSSRTVASAECALHRNANHAIRLFVDKDAQDS